MADTKHCPRCHQALTGPGVCPRCGLAVGFGPGQTPPVDAPEPPPPVIPDAPTHADLPRVETPYRSPQRPQNPPLPPPGGSPYQPAGEAPRNKQNGIVLASLGILCVLALIAGGLWFLTRDTDNDPAAPTADQDNPTQSQTPESTEPSPDDDSTEGDGVAGPLEVSVPYENQACSDALIVVLASSGDPKQDDKTIESAAQKVPETKYLQTSESCKTFNQSLNGNPIYAAYVGPFDSMADACQARTDTGIAASYVRMLSLDRELREICSCQDEATALPRLSIKTAGQPSYEIELRVYDLQSLLYLAGVNPNSTVTGTFGPDTKKMVRIFQRQQGLARDGWVGPQTWGRLLDLNCN